jgi:polyisoprenoid-binding protein YceI
MNMTSVILSVLLATSLLGQGPAQRTIDANKSTAQFSISHIWVERVTGRVPILSGSVTLDPGALIPTRVSAVLDATRLATGEPDRDRSLESPDFFDAKKFPTWTFVSTRIAPNSSHSFELDGDLTIHGVTRPERLTVTARGDAADPIYHATAQIDRHAFGMAVTRLDPTIGGIADITLDVVLSQGP